MTSLRALAFLLIFAACSRPESFSSDVVYGSAEAEPEAEDFIPNTENGVGIESTLPAPEPKPEPVREPEPEPVAQVPQPELLPRAPEPLPEPEPLPKAPEPLLDACLSSAAKSDEQTISFAENAKGCEFGKGINQNRKDGTVTAVETTTALLQLPAGRICEIGLETLATTQMRYDDMMAFAIDANLVFASTKNMLPFLQKVDGIFAWNPLSLIGKAMDFTGEAECIGGKDSCVIPPTDQSGPFSVQIPPEKFEPISLAISGKNEIPVTLSVTGDNDDSDCSHSAVEMKATIKYVP